VERTFCLVTFGCRVNQAEMLAAEEALRRRGARVTTDVRDATDVLVNSCAVTASAEGRVRRFVTRIARERPSCRVYLAGCAVDWDASGMSDLPGVTAVFPNARKDRVVDEICPEAVEGRPPQRLSRTRPILKIQEGCNANCSFCVVPSVRGHDLRSVPSDAVLEWIAAHAESPEIVLTGVLLGAYGTDLTPRVTLLDLLRRIDGRCPPIRLSSIEPWHLTPELVEFLGRASFVRPHFHVPVQTGSPGVARRMNRWLDLPQVRERLERLRELRPESGIGTDIVVGFPGETDAEFRQTLGVVDRMQFSYVHVFSYSARAGTQAAGLSGTVTARTVTERARELRAAALAHNIEFRRRCEGRVVDGVVLRENAGQPVMGITENYIKVRLPGRPTPGRGAIRITRVHEQTTEGVLVAPSAV